MKKFLALIMCLALTLSMLALASCESNGTDESNDGSTDGNSSVADSTADSSAKGDGTTDSSDNDGTADGSTADSSDGGATDSSDAGNTEGSTDSGSGDVEDDNSEKVTITFTCFANATHVSGENTVEINKGSRIPIEKMPVYTRNGYVLGWAYNVIGTELWSPSDIIDKDTELFAVWFKEDSEDALFVQLNNLLATFTSYQINSTTVITSDSGEHTSTSVTMVDGVNEYATIGAADSGGEMWYVDEVYYTYVGGKKVKTSVPLDVYQSKYKSSVGRDGILGVPKDLVKSISLGSEDGKTLYTVVVDGVKYTEYQYENGFLSLVSASYEFDDLTYKLYFDGSNVIEKAVVEFDYTVAGTKMESSTVSVFSEIGTTVVEAPKDAAEFEEAE